MNFAFDLTADPKLHLFVKEAYFDHYEGPDGAHSFMHQVFCPIIVEPDDVRMNMLENPMQWTFRLVTTDRKLKLADGRSLEKPKILFGDSIKLDDGFMSIEDERRLLEVDG